MILSIISIQVNPRCYKCEVTSYYLYKKNANDDSTIKDFINDFSKEGLKDFLMSASKEAIGLVLQALPFGGLAKAGFEAIQSIISKM